jgi:phasin family protein
MAAPDPKNSHVEKNYRPLFGEADVRLLAAAQRKNAEAIVQVSQLALDGMQHAWRRQLDFVREAIGELSTLTVALNEANGSLDGRLSRQTDYAKQSFDRILLNARELTELTTRSANEAMNLVSQRLTDGLDELHRARQRVVP